MKFILVLFILVSCTPEPEFYIDGKPYYTNVRCVKDSVYHEFGYGYGYNIMTSRFEYHLGIHEYSKCLKEQIDTIEIRTQQKYINNK